MLTLKNARFPSSVSGAQRIWKMDDFFSVLFYREKILLDILFVKLLYQDHAGTEYRS